MRATTKDLFIKLLFFILLLFCLSPFASSPLALALGIAFTIMIGNPYEKNLHKYINLLLKISIVGLGFGLQLNEAIKAGREGISLTILSIFTVMILGYFLGKSLKLERPLSYLLSVGTAICGGSAIAAVTPIIKPTTKQISLALAIVFTLNSVALFIYPSIGHLLNMTQEQFGLWCAIGIHDTSYVVGAASKFGDEALKVATTVKLSRALWIIPMSLFTVLLFKTKGVKVKIPWFIGLFVVAILIHTYIPMFEGFSKIATNAAKSGLNLTLFLIGSTISLETLRTISWKPLILAIVLWIVISVGSLLLILN
jgi:uncharacterized integral membrane protein (TIGR00698 family)